MLGERASARERERESERESGAPRLGQGYLSRLLRRTSRITLRPSRPIFSGEAPFSSGPPNKHAISTHNSSPVHHFFFFLDILSHRGGGIEANNTRNQRCACVRGAPRKIFYRKENPAIGNLMEILLEILKFSITPVFQRKFFFFLV